MCERTEVNCLVVGAGDIARKYLAPLAEGPLSVTGVCDLDAERAASLAEPFEAPSYTATTEMLAAEPAPLVLNLTSHTAHAGVTASCLAAGRHVFSEKPLATDARTAAELVEQATAAGLGLGVAPENHLAGGQRHALEMVRDGRLGSVRYATATAHVGRVRQWHDRPASFLAVGPLFDGAVYPLSLLVAWFGPVERVRTADAVALWADEPPEDETAAPHVEATISFADGPVLSLRASFYVDHRSREFYGLELHGDTGTLYLDDTGAMEGARDAVSLRGGQRDSVAAPPPWPARQRPHLAGPERLAARIEDGRRLQAGGRRAAHVVAICEAILEAAAGSGPVSVEGPSAGELSAAASQPPSPARPPKAGMEASPGASALRLPPIGFGCSRYRGGDRYVAPALGAAIDAGYRLFDSAELYGNEWRLGELLAAPGAPARETLFVVGKPWRTNHAAGDMARACRGSLSELGLEAFDCYALHWPGAWAHVGPLERLSERPLAEQERLTFPTDGDGAPRLAEHTLLESWERMEALRADGLTRTLGLSNVSLDQLQTVVQHGHVSPALIQIERHPYRPQQALVEYCRRQGIRVLAHTPLAAPGLMDDPVARTEADRLGMPVTELLLAWQRIDGVVPIPSTTTPAHAVSNLAASRRRLDARARDALAVLAGTEET